MLQRTPKPDVTTTPIVIGGSVVGEVDSYVARHYGSPFHAIIPLEFDQVTHLAQGHGDTADEAITHAIERGLSFAKDSLFHLTVLQRQRSQ